MAYLKMSFEVGDSMSVVKDELLLEMDIDLLEEHSFQVLTERATRRLIQKYKDKLEPEKGKPL